MNYALILVLAFFVGILLLAVVPTFFNFLTEKYFSKTIANGYFGATAKDERLNEDLIGHKAAFDGLNRP
ncbi:MAG: hypothetical protein GPJ54_15930 [Candidatus Heimdallarchaeota archaeon]|nr:hypothetical protein [Candidatus Heimdallarchaeota archaeon]